MINWILGLFSGEPYYLRLNRERIVIRNSGNGKTVEFRPVVGLDSRNNVTSIGDPANPGTERIVNPFDHPRVLVHDFDMAEKLCAYAFQQVSGMAPLRPAPVVVMHPDVHLDGGLTSIEARVLREMAEGGGARKVFVHYGRQLTDEEVRQFASGAAVSTY